MRYKNGSAFLAVYSQDLSHSGIVNSILYQQVWYIKPNSMEKSALQFKETVTVHGPQDNFSNQRQSPGKNIMRLPTVSKKTQSLNSRRHITVRTLSITDTYATANARGFTVLYFACLIGRKVRKKVSKESNFSVENNLSREKTVHYGG